MLRWCAVVCPHVSSAYGKMSSKLRPTDQYYMCADRYFCNSLVSWFTLCCSIGRIAHNNFASYYTVFRVSFQFEQHNSKLARCFTTAVIICDSWAVEKTSRDSWIILFTLETDPENSVSDIRKGSASWLFSGICFVYLHERTDSI